MASKNWALFVLNKHGAYAIHGLVSDKNGAITVGAEKLAEIIPFVDGMVEVPSFANQELMAALDKWKRERGQ